MADSLAGVVLAAGAGTRLAPLSRLRPKAMCPVVGRPLVDHALDRLESWTGDLAVNLHHGRHVLDAHLPVGVHRSVEQTRALGTAGALGALRSWIDGRDVLVTNADAWFPPGVDLSELVEGWDRERVRLLCVWQPDRGDFGPLRYSGVALLPWSRVASLAAEPSGLYEKSWAAEAEAGRLDLVVHDGAFVDCGTPADYLEANLLGSAGESVIGEGATVASQSTLVRTVVWDHAEVGVGEVLVDAVRAGPLTVLVR